MKNHSGGNALAELRIIKSHNDSFGDLWMLQDLSFDVQRRHFVPTSLEDYCTLEWSVRRAGDNRHILSTDFRPLIKKCSSIFSATSPVLKKPSCVSDARVASMS